MMSTVKRGSEKMGSDEEHHLNRSLTTITLSNEQFEQLYLQPRDARRSYTLAGIVGNPTPL